MTQKTDDMCPKTIYGVTDQTWIDLAKKLATSKDDEACIACLLRVHCIAGDIRKLIGCAKVSRWKFEFNVVGGRVDLVLFHSDGGVTLVEIKAGNTPCTVVPGIGQLFFYEAQFPRSQMGAALPLYINKVLVATCLDEHFDAIDSTCSLAGVKFIKYPSFREIDAHRQRLRKTWSAYGKEVVTDA